MHQVSVVIPTYNRKEYVQIAIESVLAQTYTDLEIIVVDDGSTDATDRALQARYGDRIRYEWQSNQGESAARNRGIALAKGDFVAFLDSDDVWLPHKLARQMGVMADRPDVGLVVCQAWRIDRSGQRMPGLPFGPPVEGSTVGITHLLRRNVLGPAGSSALVRSSVFHVVGGFELDLTFGEDWDMWLRISRHSGIYCLAEPLVEIRFHQSAQQHRVLGPGDVQARLDQHLELITRARDRWPDQISPQAYDDAVAVQYLTASVALMAGGDESGSQHCLMRAWHLAPSVCGGSPEYREAVIAAALQIAHEPTSLQPEKALGFARKALEKQAFILRAEPQARRSLLDDRMISDLYVHLGFLLFAAGRTDEGGRCMLRAIWLHPLHLSNGGVLSVVAESLLGRRLVTKARPFVRAVRHRLKRGSSERLSN